MKRGELFNLVELRTPLTPDQKNSALRFIVDAARLGVKYFYTIKETCGILSLSRDEIDLLIHLYRLDSLVLRRIFRIPWYSIAEYLLDTEDDIEEVFGEFIRSRYRAA